MSDTNRDDTEHLDESSKGVSRRTVIGAAGTLGVAVAALSAGFPRSAAAQTSEGGYFALEIQDFFSAKFPEGRIESETVVPDNGARIPNTKWNSIELKRGIDQDKTLWEWRKMIIDGKLKDARKNGSITAYNQKHQEVARWNFENAWPSKVQWGGFDPLRTEFETPPVTWEAVTLEVEALQRAR